MKQSHFQLGLFGLSRLERAAVASVCALTRTRSRGYSVLPAERSDEAQIALVDADDADARNSWLRSMPHVQGLPALLIAGGPRPPSEPYYLPRAGFAARLLRVLDEITIQEFKCLPDLIVSDVSVSGAPATRAHATTAAIAENAARILVIDDSLVVRTALGRFLQLHGLHVDGVEDAESGLALARRQAYAMVFLDVMLPGIDGYAACRQLRTAARNQAMSIVMLTGRNSTFDRVRGLMAGCSRYLTKPVNAEALNEVLREFLPASPVPRSSKAVS